MIDLENDRPIIIYGTGDGASVLISHLIEKSVSISAVAASDDFARNRIFMGYKVLKISEVLKKLPNALVVVAFGSDRPDVIHKINELNSKHDLIVAEIPLCGDFFDKNIYQKDREKIDFCRGLFADKQSVLLFDSMLRYKLYNRFDDLMEFTEKREESLELLNLNNDMIYADIGAYRGETLDDFKKVYAFEPAEKNFIHLKENIKIRDGEVIPIQKAVTQDNKGAYISQNNGRGVKISDKGIKVETVSLNEYFKDKRVNFIKMDIEGQEKQALIGADKILKRDRPALLISAYHYTDDFYKIPILINEIYKEVKIYLRREKCFPAWELNVYVRPDNK